MKKTLTVAMAVLVILALPAMAFAGSPWSGDKPYGEKAIDKLTFGLKNTVLGWTELIKQPIDRTKDIKSFFGGVGHGVMNTVTYTLGGALHLVTFPITSIDVPIPNDGVKF